MKHAITCAHLCTCLKFLRHTFICTSKTNMNLSRAKVFPYLECLPMYLNQWHQNGWFWGSFVKFSLQLFFRNANGWYSKQFKQTFLWNTSACLWMNDKKIIYKWVIVAKWYLCQINECKSCIGHILFFKILRKLYRNTV